MHDDKLHVNFEDKCDAFISVMYPKQSFNDVESVDHSTDEIQDGNQYEWPEIIENEIHTAIFTFNSKKACEPDGINFLIIQRAYKITHKLFLMLYPTLVKIGYHLMCWRNA